jgi:glutaredoxin
MKLYGNGCKYCNILQGELDEKGLTYEKIVDMDEIVKVGMNNGIRNMPILEVDENVMDYRKALEYVKGV